MQWVELEAEIPKRHDVPAGHAADNVEEFYDALGLWPTATAAEVKAAYRELARLSHPDLLPESERAAAEEHMKWINRAYNALYARLVLRAPVLQAPAGDGRASRA